MFKRIDKWLEKIATNNMESGFVQPSDYPNPLPWLLDSFNNGYDEAVEREVLRPLVEILPSVAKTSVLLGRARITTNPHLDLVVDVSKDELSNYPFSALTTHFTQLSRLVEMVPERIDWGKMNLAVTWDYADDEMVVGNIIARVDEVWVVFNLHRVSEFTTNKDTALRVTFSKGDNPEMRLEGAYDSRLYGDTEFINELVDTRIITGTAAENWRQQRTLDAIAKRGEKRLKVKRFKKPMRVKKKPVPLNYTRPPKHTHTSNYTRYKNNQKPLNGNIYHIVRVGDTLARIATMHGTSIGRLRALNNNMNHFSVGDKILVKRDVPMPYSVPISGKAVSGANGEVRKVYEPTIDINSDYLRHVRYALKSYDI